MFMVSEAETAEIRKALEAGGEFDAMLKLRELFPGVAPDQARECVRTIATWKPFTGAAEGGAGRRRRSR